MRVVVLVSLVIALISACSSAPVSKRDVQQLTGAQMYELWCSSCHGAEGLGDGPVAPLIKIGVPDLTRIAHRDGGEFPTEDVRRTIDGRWDRRAHGARDMPVWGWQLYDGATSDDAAARARTDALIDRLVAHLQSIQRP